MVSITCRTRNLMIQVDGRNAVAEKQALVKAADSASIPLGNQFVYNKGGATAS